MTNPVMPLLERYGESHQNRINRRIHYVCVPLIEFSLLGLLWLIVLPLLPESLPYVMSNLCTWVVAVFFVYYFRLSVPLAIGMTILTGSMLFIIAWLHYNDSPILEISLSIFIVAWIGQFIGHAIEGNKPSFFEDIRFLAIGPLWTLSHLYEALGLTGYRK